MFPSTLLSCEGNLDEVIVIALLKVTRMLCYAKQFGPFWLDLSFLR